MGDIVKKSKILIIDWDFISADMKGWYGFPVHGHLVKKWLDTGTYERKTMDLYNNMRASSVFSTLPSDSPIRWLISMFRWFYFKQKDYLGVDQYGEGLEDVFASDPELVEHLYNEYYQYFLENSSFTINDQIQRLIDRKPDDWELGIVSLDRTREEIELILSDKFSAIQEYRKIFAHRLCTDSPIRSHAPPPIHESVQFVSEEIDAYSLRDDLDVYILSNIEFKKHLYFPQKISVIEIWGDKTVDDFDFNNPDQVLVEPNIEKVSENTENGPKKIAHAYDIIFNKFPFIQKTRDFFEDTGEIIGGALLVYTLLVIFISSILDWFGLIDSYSDSMIYTIGIPFFVMLAVWVVFWGLLLIFLILTEVPVAVINRFYENKELGLDTRDATWKAVKPVIIWTPILILLAYIV
ncbi:hypothetical protein HUE58_05875 [Candidatus Ruthia endofausta]|uniref:Uncharacterized protein n=1 Tax=Candidatus Ruthia endofausta TaxID=2738852 RepID=A0A6N0HQK6_9GAMM|nr:hypothetical protein [Candidatus Ruthia endofausta]QKQ24623.1 hypothetical protein HUE58_05875 [Candidatus Ruthia endofausta]